MPKSVLYSSLKKKYSATDLSIKILDKKLREQNILRGEYIIQQGDALSDILFLVKGAVITTLTRDDKEFVVNISTESDILTIPLRKHSSATLIAIEDCTILRMNFLQFEKQMSKNIDLANLGYQIFKELATLTAKFHFGYIGLEATEAYKRIIKERPAIANRIPLKFIASYLGVTPSSLSRIRASAFKKIKK